MTYSFHCNDCGKDFNLNISYANYQLALYFNCPSCNSVDTTRRYEPTTVIFKGDGFTKATKEEE